MAAVMLHFGFLQPTSVNLWKPNTPPQLFLFWCQAAPFFPLSSSAQYVLPVLCTGQADIANSIAFSMAVPIKFCRKCVAACVWKRVTYDI